MKTKGYFRGMVIAADMGTHLMDLYYNFETDEVREVHRKKDTGIYFYTKTEPMIKFDSHDLGAAWAMFQKKLTEMRKVSSFQEQR